MKYFIYILSIAILAILSLFIFTEVTAMFSGRLERYEWLALGYFVLPGIFIANIIRTIFTYVHFKKLTVIRPLPYLLNGLTMYLLLGYSLPDEYVGYAIIYSMTFQIIVEINIINEVRRGKQYGRVL